MFIHIPTGRSFENRKQAKQEMGHCNYNRAVRNREFTFHDGRKMVIFDESTEFVDKILQK